jgi:hypothetical protein
MSGNWGGELGEKEFGAPCVLESGRLLDTAIASAAERKAVIRVGDMDGKPNGGDPGLDDAAKLASLVGEIGDVGEVGVIGISVILWMVCILTSGTLFIASISDFSSVGVGSVITKTGRWSYLGRRTTGEVARGRSRNSNEGSRFPAFDRVRTAVGVAVASNPF